MAKKINGERKEAPKDAKDLSEILFYSILKSEIGESKLTPDTTKIQSMATARVRHLFNNIGAQISSYLEVGTYTGGSAIAIAHDNPDVKVVTIDDFSHVDLDDEANALGLRETAKKNLAPYPNVEIIEQDAFRVELTKHKGVEFFFYDGAHDEPSQHGALLHYHHCWADTVLVCIDDWNFHSAQHGTLTALEKIPFRRVFSLHLEGTIEPEIDAEGYWNGLWFAILKRK